jgi:hypothetical protein
MAMQAGGSLALSWNVLAGVSYQVQYTPSLDAIAWTNLGDPLTASEGLKITTSDPAPSTTQRFYRVVLVP